MTAAVVRPAAAAGPPGQPAVRRARRVQQQQCPVQIAMLDGRAPIRPAERAVEHPLQLVDAHRDPAERFDDLGIGPEQHALRRVAHRRSPEAPFCRRQFRRGGLRQRSGRHRLGRALLLPRRIERAVQLLQRCRLDPGLTVVRHPGIPWAETIKTGLARALPAPSKMFLTPYPLCCVVVHPSVRSQKGIASLRRIVIFDEDRVTVR